MTERNPLRTMTMVTVVAATVLVATTTGSLGLPLVTVAGAAAVTAVGTAAALLAARAALGGSAGLPAVAAALVLSVLGAVTAQELTGGGVKFAAGTTAGIGAFTLVAWFSRRFHDRLPSWTLPVATASVFGCLALTRMPGFASPVAMADGTVAHVNAALAGIVFQPGELVRPLIAAVIATYVARSILVLRRGGRAVIATVCRIGVPIIAVTALFVLNADLGPLLFLLLMTVALVLIVRPHPLVWICAVGAVAVGAVGAYFAVATVRVRVHQMLYPIEEDGGITNIGLGLRAISSGGWWGSGVGEGTPNEVYFAESDFVFTTVGHIRGGVMLLLVLILYAVIIRSVWLASARATGITERLVATSSALLLTIQILWTTAANVGVLPLTGMVVPFLSSGISAMIGMWCTLAIVLSLGRRLPVVHTPHADHRLTLSRLQAVGAVMVVGVVTVGAVVTPRVDPASTVPKDWALRRGMIVAADGTVLAATDTDTETRVYPEGALFGDLIGFTKRGDGQGLEEAERSRLSCENTGWQQLFDVPCTPPTLVTTFVPELQRVAAESLAGMVGDAVVIDLHTDAVLAAYSTDAFDPTLATSTQGKDAGEYLQRWRSDERTKNGPAFSSYATAPGSVFKLVTAAAALETGVPTGTEVSDGYTAPGGNQIIRNANSTVGGGSLQDALAASANTAFAEIATRVGDEHLRTTASTLTDLPGSAGSFASEPITLGAEALDADALARSGFGQQGVRATPLALTVLGAQIAGGGETPTLRYAQGMCTNGRYHSFPRIAMGPRMSSDTAGALKEAMLHAVDEGRVPALVNFPGGAGAKTGTAERPDGAYDGTIVAFAPAEEPRYVVSVRVEGAVDTDRSGGVDAGPVAAALLSAVLAGPDPALADGGCSTFDKAQIR